ncbi:MAG: hypothetical protein JNN11_01395 [Candidatus Doudnabacteria bacterium]|nr:hypothetical protein [Candidatus Doudnabacteria bacterium]
MSEILNLVKSFNWQTPTWDLFILGAWVLASVFYAFAAGRGRIINILISVYMAKLLVLEAPFLAETFSQRLPSALASLQQLSAFVAIFLVLFLLLGRFVFKTSADHRHMSSMFFGLFFAFLQVGLLINIVLGLLPAGVQESFSLLIRTIFLHPSSAFVWLVLPVVYLVALGKFVGDSSEI